MAGSVMSDRQPRASAIPIGSFRVTKRRRSASPSDPELTLFAPEWAPESRHSPCRLGPCGQPRVPT